MGTVKPGLLLLVLVPIFGMAQSAKDSWDNLRQLHPGQKIEVVDTSMQSLRGTVVSFSEEALTLQVGKTQQSIERAKVVRLSVRTLRTARATCCWELAFWAELPWRQLLSPSWPIAMKAIAAPPVRLPSRPGSAAGLP
jgi:hypothetical protein